MSLAFRLRGGRKDMYERNMKICEIRTRERKTIHELASQFDLTFQRIYTILEKYLPLYEATMIPEKEKVVKTK